MFKLTDAEIQNAFEAICHHGYSAMLPEPHEWNRVVEYWQKVKDYIAQRDLDTYDPYKPLEVFAPKSRANIRVVHLLHPEDLIIYTALVLIVKDDIEKARLSTRTRRVFSYRAKIGKSNRLYDARGAHDQYLEQLDQKAQKAETKFVGLADIADFYPRIYQHRLENVIESISSDQRGVDVARVLVRKLISNLMGRNSYGIPVGPYASRILGEAVLIDVDAFLTSNNIDFVRWVDDYNIFCKSEYIAQSTLFSLAEWLYKNHGLTLQSAKTKILPKTRFVDEVLSKPEENLTDRDHVISLLKGSPGTGEYSDEYEEEEPDEGEIEAILEDLHRYDLYGMFVESISDEALVDFEIVKYVLTRLPRITIADDSLRTDILDLVIDNAELLYPVAEFIAKYVISLEDLTAKQKKAIAKKLLRPLRSSRNRPPDYYAMWVLHIFSTSAEWNNVSGIIGAYRAANSEVVKRYAALAVSVCGTRAEALVVKDDLTAASPLLRLAILSASTRLGNDERKHWKLANHINGVVEKIV